jgi:transcriptional regulator with XRE-family HTH domain
MDFGEALKRTLFEAGISAAELSRLSGVNITQVLQFKNGRRDITASNLQKIIEALPYDARVYLLKLSVLADDKGSNDQLTLC